MSTMTVQSLDIVTEKGVKTMDEKTLQEETLVVGEMGETPKHNSLILNRLAALMSVKSIVTLALTGVFAYMACTNQISQDFMTIYAVIIAFYFGTQSQKVQNVLDKES